MSDSLWPHRLQHIRLPCSSLSPTVYSNACPLSWWCYLTISSSAILFSFAFFFSQHQGLFQWISSSHQIAKVSELQLQPQSFQWIFRVWLTGLISLQSKGLSTIFSSTTFQKHQFFDAQPSLWSNSYIHMWLLELSPESLIKLSTGNSAVLFWGYCTITYEFSYNPHILKYSSFIKLSSVAQFSCASFSS